MPAVAETLDAVRIATESGYRLGFETDLAQEIFPAGRDEATVRALSARKDEPALLLEWRLKAFRAW
jgi:Fe-S cluster assembly protein SufB